MEELRTIAQVIDGVNKEESLATYGPFVMNTNKELVVALADYEAGKFGELN